MVSGERESALEITSSLASWCFQERPHNRNSKTGPSFVKMVSRPWSCGPSPLTKPIQQVECSSAMPKQAATRSLQPMHKLAKQVTANAAQVP